MKPDNNFDVIARYYDLLYASRDDDLDMWLEFLTEIDGNVLEIGCGTGRVMLPLLQNGYNVTGIDISEIALDAAKAKMKTAGLENEGTLHRADMFSLDLPEKNFAFAFVPINTFMHCLTMADQQNTLRSIYNHLQPGGTVVIDLYHPNPTNLLEADGRTVLADQFVDDLTGRMVQWFVARHLDADTQTQQVTYILDEIDDEGVVRRGTFSFPMRYVHRFEMELLLKQSGFEVEEVFGDYDLSAFQSDSARMIFVAKKKST